MKGRDSFESLVSSTSLLALPPDILLAAMAEPFLGWKQACVFSMVNDRMWKFFCDYRIENLLLVKNTDHSTDINSEYIKAFITRLRLATDLARTRGSSVAEIFRQVSQLEKIVATMPEPARQAVSHTLPALSSRDVFATGTIAEHVITCVSALQVNYEQ